MKFDELVFNSIIKCPECGFEKEEKMPRNSCMHFYECESCKQLLRPLESDCCVFCSYGTVVCPPKQKDIDCC